MADNGPVSGPAVRDDAPVADDFGEVVRPIVASTDTTNGGGIVLPVGLASVPLLADNPNRLDGKGFVINNSATDYLFVALAATATLDDVPVPPRSNMAFASWLGPVSAIRAGGADTAKAVEFLHS